MRMVVTPFAGVWIEIFFALRFSAKSVVTPFAGVWIEILSPSGVRLPAVSLPLRECGLKSHLPVFALWWKDVTPFAGVWIEIVLSKHPTNRY